MQKALNDPSAEESRTCAILALKAISEHELLDASTPKLDLTKYTEQELVDLFVAMQMETARRQTTPVKICIQCGELCANDGRGYAMYPSGWMHTRCTLAYARKKVYGQ